MTRPSRRTHAPQALDVAAFCREGARLQGRWALEELPRLGDSVLRAADGAPAAAPLPAPASGQAPADAVHWSASGTMLRLPGGAAQCAVELDLRSTVGLECQRCLQPLVVPLTVRRRVRFVEGDDEAARLDEELDDDVLALVPRLDLRALVEDELLLALPLVPRHEVCPQLPEVQHRSAADAPWQTPTAGAPGPAAAPHPFAALAALRRPKG